MAWKAPKAKGTCDWLTRHQKFLDWRHSNQSDMLWISGGPGRGKTVLAVHAVSHLQENKSAKERVLYFFCESGYAQRDEIDGILRDLSHQLLQQQPSLVEHIRDDFQAVKRDGPLVPLKTISTIFEKLLRHSNAPIVCVLDALDECRDPDNEIARFLRFMKTLASSSSSSGCSFKLLLFSRAEPKCIGRVLQGGPRVNLDNSPEVQEDVAKFIGEKIKELGSQPDVRLSKHNLNQVKNHLTKHAKGSFLWVGYVADDLVDQPWSQVSSRLKNHPRGLVSVYRGILMRVLNGMRGTAKEKRGETRRLASILRWVVLSQEPLRLGELAMAIMVEDSEVQTGEDILRDVVRSCGYLFQREDAEGRVLLLHQSVKELLQNREQLGDDLQVFLVEQSGHAELADRCLTYLERVCSSSTSAAARTNISSSPKSRFLDYAARYWPEHMKNVSRPIGNAFNLSRPFWCDSDLRKAWETSYCKSCRPAEFPGSFYRLHLAAYFGITSLASTLIQTRSEMGVQSLDSEKKTPLIHAAGRGHVAFVQLLLDNGADINLPGPYEMTALHWAAKEGRKAVVLTLVERGAKIEAQEDGGGTPLARGIESGSKETIETLLKCGAEVDFVYELSSSRWGPGPSLSSYRASELRSNFDGHVGRGLLIFGVVQVALSPLWATVFSFTPVLQDQVQHLQRILVS